MKDIFTPAVTAALVDRLRALEPGQAPAWGKMNVAQMLAHCSVPYEMIFEDRHPRPGLAARLFLRLFVKRSVTSDRPYRKNLPTAPPFKVAPEQDFHRERERLIGYLERTLALGGDHFDGKEHPTFGPLTREEWSNLFHKHLDHHLTQFGV